MDTVDLLSPLAYNTGLLGGIDLLPRDLPHPFAVIFDTSASLAISPCRADFIGPITPCPTERKIGGLTQGLLLIEGTGVVEWTFKAGYRTLVVRSRCYFVPDAKARLVSPQRLFDKSKGVTGQYIVEEDKSTLSFDGCDDLIVDYDTCCFLPIAMA